MNLVFDLGNTNHKCAVFDGDSILFQRIKPKFEVEDILPIFQEFDITAILLSSVDKPDSVFEGIFLDKKNYFILSRDTPIPVTNKYLTPETLGKDRLASAIGANLHFPNTNVLVIDAGTCIKYDFINAENQYLGGAIAPGLHMRLKAMHNFTARLPLLEPVQENALENIALTGGTTNTSMISGTYNGALYEMAGMIEAYSSKYPNLTVVITGGDAHFFVLHLKRQIFALPNLVLEGLNTILNFNLNHN